MIQSYCYEDDLQINDEMKCPICLGPFENPLKDTHCGHHFCYVCLEKWMHKKLSCPICRQYFTSFGPVTNETLLEALDCLPVQCLHCQTKNIRRRSFDKHLHENCSGYSSCETSQTYDTAMKLNTILKNTKRKYESDEQVGMHDNFQCLSVWVMLLSSTHLLLYIIILVPIAFVMYIGDCIFCPIVNVILSLIQIIHTRL